MTKKASDGRAACDLDRDDQSKSSSRPQDAKRTAWKRYLTFLTKFQDKVKHKAKYGDARAPPATCFKQRHTKKPKRYGPVLEECSTLVRVVRRPTAGCIAAAMAIASAAGDKDNELPSYAQLDQANYGVKRETFGHVGCLVQGRLVQL